MKFAHSLGYPHYDLMLGQLSATQWMEIQKFFRVESDRTQRIDAENMESKLRAFFSRKIAAQQKAQSG